MTGRIKDLQITLDADGRRMQHLTLELDGDFTLRFDALKSKILDIELSIHKEKRTLRANAYFHVLAHRIADEKARQGFNESNDTVKKRLVIDYGTLARDSKNNVIGFKLPSSADVDSIYPYTQIFDTRTENGKEFNCYKVFKRTSEMNVTEMCRLIDGAIYEAKELGLETDTPEEVAKMKALWKEGEK